MISKEEFLAQVERTVLPEMAYNGWKMLAMRVAVIGLRALPFFIICAIILSERLSGSSGVIHENNTDAVMILAFIFGVVIAFIVIHGLVVGVVTRSLKKQMKKYSKMAVRLLGLEWVAPEDTPFSYAYFTKESFVLPKRAVFSYASKKDFVDECFVGQYQGRKIYFYDVIMRGQKNKPCFQGPLIVLENNQEWGGHVLAISRNWYLGLGSYDKLEKQRIGSDNFEKKFYVYADQASALNKVMTPGMQDGLIKIHDLYEHRMGPVSAISSRFCFKDKYTLIAIDCKKDLFEVTSLFSAGGDIKMFEKFYDDVAQALEVVKSVAG